MQVSDNPPLSHIPVLTPKPCSPVLQISFPATQHILVLIHIPPHCCRGSTSSVDNPHSSHPVNSVHFHTSSTQVALFPVMYIAICIIIWIFPHSRALQSMEETLLLPLSKEESFLQAAYRCKNYNWVINTLYAHISTKKVKG
jgi:hypothetical protein